MNYYFLNFNFTIVPVQNHQGAIIPPRKRNYHRRNQRRISVAAVNHAGVPGLRGGGRRAVHLTSTRMCVCAGPAERRGASPVPREFLSVHPDAVDLPAEPDTIFTTGTSISLTASVAQPLLNLSGVIIVANIRVHCCKPLLLFKYLLLLFIYLLKTALISSTMGCRLRHRLGVYTQLQIFSTRKGVIVRQG